MSTFNGSAVIVVLQGRNVVDWRQRACRFLLDTSPGRKSDGAVAMSLIGWMWEPVAPSPLGSSSTPTH